MADIDEIKEQVQAKVDAMEDLSFEQIMDFISRKGNERKRQVFEITGYQTRDAKNSSNRVRSLMDMLEKRRARVADFDAEMAKKAAEIESLDQQIKDLDNNVRQKGGAKAELAGVVSQKRAALDGIVGSFSESNTKELSKYFESENNSSLVKGIEAFVALLRNNKTASNVDVELYIKDHNKLMHKLRKSDVANLTAATVEFHKKNLDTLAGAFKNSSHADYQLCSNYAHFIAYAQAYADYATVALQVIDAEKSLNEVDETKNKINGNKEMNIDVMKLVEDQGFKGLLQEATDSLENRIEGFEHIQEQDHQQATDYQMLYHRFEKNYFSGFIEFVNGLKEE